MEQQYLFRFMEALNKDAAENAKEIENSIYEDPKGCVIKARLFAEEIIKDVLGRENVDYSNLPTHYDRISYLTREGIINREIQQTLTSIRIVGNKAVHEASFKPDIIEAIKIFKEMYKLGVWFTEVYSANIEIPKYRDPSPPKKGFELDDIQSLIEDALRGKLGQYLDLTKKEEKDETFSDQINEELEKSKEQRLDKDDNKETLFPLDLSEGRSYLLRELKRLRESSQEAVENANSFSKFKDYMHVKREIQNDFEDMLNKTHDSVNAELILLSGSVGDGKSHLLAYFNEKWPEIIKKYTVLNDATESFSPNKNAIETLSELLDGFSDQKIEQSNDKVILAINLGVLHNFLLHEHEGKTFNKLKEFIDASGLFSQKVTTKFSKDGFNLIGFSDYQAYELTENGPKSSFYSQIFSKVFTKDSNNPFYLAYEEDLKRKVNGVIHENFEFLMDENVQSEIIQLVIQGIVRNKLVISARAFYNFIADLIIPESYTELSDFEWNAFEKLNQTVPSLLFTRKDRSVILKTISYLDPIHLRSQVIDQINIDINTLSDWGTIIKKYTLHSLGKKWLEPVSNQNEIPEELVYEFSKSLVRLTYLTNKEFAKDAVKPSYKNYMKYLYHFNKADKKQVESFYKEVIQTIFKWRGSPQNGYVYINKPNERFRIAQALSPKPSMAHLVPINDEVLTSFRQTFHVVFTGNNNEKIELDVDYPLYDLLSKVLKGYCPNKKDEEDAIKFVEFLDHIMKFGNQSEAVLIHIPSENKKYTLSKGLFGGYEFKKEQGQ
ncbi:DNA phosphorothioation-dependent restriction protein DptF [Fredinandcohnia onubensis]|uniref:DNA phosphorothioation-dependent restriction protein DptF n=1 Tax=Fredinandcohnia onubensis TaxID=1571209 RepID=UPI0015D51B06|nr:DNA phosphorothioation-dependent restriction protein DptF [Fredinandcohnia onubensis]